MRSEIFCTHVEGMICVQCEDIICETLNFTRGIIHVKTNYWKGTVEITYDPELIGEEEVKKVLQETGYPASEKKTGGIRIECITLVCIVALLIGLQYLKLPAIPKIKSGISSGYLFLIGLVTGTHCITMCGGIMLSQITEDSVGKVPEKIVSMKKMSAYQIGRVLTCVLLGMVFGKAGYIVSYSEEGKKMIYTLAGAAVLFTGICMWGIIPVFRRIQMQIPAVCQFPGKWQRLSAGKPFLIGMFTGIMPCTASNTMWLYAMTTGNALKGGISMLFWSLGTALMMMVLGFLSRLVPRKFQKYMVRINTILVVTLGLQMMLKGFR